MSRPGQNIDSLLNCTTNGLKFQQGPCSHLEAMNTDPAVQMVYSIPEVLPRWPLT